MKYLIKSLCITAILNIFFHLLEREQERKEESTKRENSICLFISQKPARFRDVASQSISKELYQSLHLHDWGLGTCAFIHSFSGCKLTRICIGTITAGT